jgi:hypothetical protein
MVSKSFRILSITVGLLGAFLMTFGVGALMLVSTGINIPAYAGYIIFLPPFVFPFIIDFLLSRLAGTGERSKIKNTIGAILYTLSALLPASYIMMWSILLGLSEIS